MVYITLHKSKPRASADITGILDTTRWILKCGFSNKRAPFRLMHTAVWHCRWYHRSWVSKGSMMIHSLAPIEQCIEGIFFCRTVIPWLSSVLFEKYMCPEAYIHGCVNLSLLDYIPSYMGRPLFSQLPE